MINIFPRNSLVIHRAINGFIVNVKGTIEQQEDGLDGVHVFEDIEKLNEFIKTYYKKSNKQMEVDVKNCKFRKIDSSSPFQTGDVKYFCIGR